MVVTKVMQIKRTDRLSRSVRYILDDAKTLETDLSKDNQFPLVIKDGKVYHQLVSGHHISNLSQADIEMCLTKKLADQRLGRKEQSDLKSGKGVLAHHLIQSFSPEDNLSLEEIHEIGRQTVLELTGGHHEFVMATHVDKDHIHNHIIFSSTNTVTLKKFRWQKHTKRKLELISDRLSDLKGAKIIDKKSDLFNHTKYEAYKKTNSFKQEIKSRCDFLLKHATSLDDFKQKASLLNLAVDFSGKHVTYKLLDKDQERNTRDSALSKRGGYTLSAIERRTAQNKIVLPIEEIKKEYEKAIKEKANDFEMRLTIEPWQVQSETQTGIYVQVDYGLFNQGVIKIPRRQIDSLEAGKFEVFIKKIDYFYFMNQDKSENNRYMKGDVLMRQLAYNNGQVVLNKHSNISKLDQLIKEFEFLSVHGVSDGQQFEALSQTFKEQFESTQKTLDKIDDKLIELNKLSSALLAFENGDDAAIAILQENHIEPRIGMQGQIEKQILEATVERDVLQDKLNSVASDYKIYEKVRDHNRHRTERDKELEERRIR
ncbi:relaxase/mobilization nuclease domain-containing protein [Streptococcus parauberis]|uniref:relaxase/mobilization nuclease domain-containing protein n=1 Tax=Streptococcus parauberis TaxID=1348 RepID=UPI000CCF7864|nr:relaxase/mobilization nuclease domain-containing protein [Streptococcus parauberis]MDT2749381.1 relaxase/mobilization nuclease domain-containing protein [Streptococcus parauberis]PNY21505.1 Relaxase/mobilization nuclease domain protein [Streptococcus parauberis]